MVYSFWNENAELIQIVFIILCITTRGAIIEKLRAHINVRNFKIVFWPV